MKMRRLTAQQAVKLLGEFYDTCPDQMEAGFGWEHAPDQIGRNETIFEFRDKAAVPDPAHPAVPDVEKEVVVGFGILEMNLRDAADTEAFLSAGVFPPYRRRGYWHKIMDMMIDKAKALGADFAARVVMKENEEHYRRSMREAHSEGSGWIYAGDHWHPAPGYGYFIFPFDEKERAEGKAAGKEHTE